MYLPEAVTKPTNRNFTIPINVTESHFGYIELIFLCNGQQLNVSHRSVTQLQQNTSTTVSELNWNVVTRSADNQAHDEVVVTLSRGKRNQAEDNVVVGSGGSDSGGDNLHPETRGEYVALDRNAVQPSNICEQLGTYEEIGNM
ncbi:uncharacterized protein [Haliotis cracherodii]|uniref:uncharacterized protein n=1 Tax=Haliotis cracherodii TaxID=6455 RepID=UPI0039E81C6C